MGNYSTTAEGPVMSEKEFVDYLDYLDDYWSVFGPIPPCVERKIIKLALL